MARIFKGGPIFVFGSNLAGRHGAGAAKDAVKYYGARYGKGEGHHGCSYAIPTKDKNLNPLPLDEIRRYVRRFLGYAALYSHLTFRVTRVGCGLAGYKDEQIAPMFSKATNNCILPKEWIEIMQPKAKTCIDGEKHQKLLPRTLHSVCRQSTGDGMRFGFEIHTGSHWRSNTELLPLTSSYDKLRKLLQKLVKEKDFLLRHNYKFKRLWFKDEKHFWKSIEALGRNTRYNKITKSWAPLFKEEIAKEFSDNIVTVTKEIYKPRVPNKYIVKGKHKVYSRDLIIKLHEYCVGVGITECAALVKIIDSIENPQKYKDSYRMRPGQTTFYLDPWFGIDDLGLVSFLIFYDRSLAYKVYANSAYKLANNDDEEK